MTGRSGGRAKLPQLLWRGAFLAVAIVVAALALLPNLQLPDLGMPQGANDLLQHFLAFSALGGLGGFAWTAPRTSLAGVAVFAVALELSQAFAPGREVHLDDALASIAGAAAGTALIAGWRALRQDEAG